LNPDENINEKIQLILQKTDNTDNMQLALMNVLNSMNEGLMNKENFEMKIYDELSTLMKNWINNYEVTQSGCNSFLIQNLTRLQKELVYDLNNKLQYIMENINEEKSSSEIIEVIGKPQKEILDMIQLVLERIISEPAKLGENI
jgi:hypothetical protein